MPYKGTWAIQLQGEGKIYPLDEDSIDELFVNLISILMSAGQNVDLNKAIIHKSQVEQY